MRQSQKLPIFTVVPGMPLATVGIIAFLAIMLTGCTGCKKTITVEVPEAKLQAKDATLDELLRIVNQFDGIRGLKAAKLKAEFTSEKREGDLTAQEEWEKYPKSPGYVVLRNPDSMYFVVRDPAFNTTRLRLVSVGDEFRVWYPGKNTLYIGKNSSKELISDELEPVPKIPIRANHIFEAILPEAIPSDDPEIRIILTEEEDASSKYYYLMICREDVSRRLFPIRAFWIERSRLSVARQRTYGDGGQVMGDITYSDVQQYGQFAIPQRIRLQRPSDGYTLELEVTDWQVNPDMSDDLFELKPAPGAKVIHFK